MKKVKIAQIGLGHDHASAIFGSLRKLTDYFDFVGYAVPPEEKGRFTVNAGNIPERTVEDILADPTITAVAVETEEVNLTNFAQMAADAGKHIHMDKPGGLSLPDFEKLVRTVKEKHLVFHLGYMYRYNPAILELLDRVRAGELGEIYSVEAHMDCRHTPEKRQWLETFPGGMMFFLGCHLVDLLLLFRGQPERIVPFQRSTGLDGVTAEDYGMVVFEYPNGVSFAKTCAEEMGGFERRQLVVCGSKGTVELRPLEMFGHFEGQYTGVRVSTSADWFDAGYRTATRPLDRYDPMMEGFYRMVIGEKENPFTPDYELEVYKTVLKSCGVNIE